MLVLTGGKINYKDILTPFRVTQITLLIARYKITSGITSLFFQAFTKILLALEN